MMAAMLTFIYVIPMLLSAAQVQEASPFEGRWEARLKGAVVCTIELGSGERPRGTTSACQIDIDSEGNLIEGDPADAPNGAAPSPISNARVKSGVLTFELKAGEGPRDVIRFEMRIAGKDTAELLILNFPTAVKPKPIRFTRAAAR